ncbi:MAG TPA: glycosyltransferase family A protein [Candidatus Limnocylindria bacterium]|nr:glycosyltransferase family A protein [Candidatus Limnocylindria bacterium]
MTDLEGLVSVVISTRGRAELLLRAIGSVLAQTYGLLEIVVVVDGPDEETELALGGVHDDRLRWQVNGQSVGGSEARNVGVRAARGEWVAFLDDDDEWLPAKLERQVELLRSVAGPALVSCRIITRTPRGEFVGPEREPRPTEHLSEYLFRPAGRSRGERGCRPRLPSYRVSWPCTCPGTRA